MSLALLEVMDKEPTLPEMWIAAAIFGGIGFWSARRWVWPGPLFLAWNLLWLASTHYELTDRFLGPDIREEAGYGYVVQSYALAIASVVATATGLAWGIARWWRRRGERGARPRDLAPLEG